MKITMYEFLGMIKDGKAPNKIKYRDDIYTMDDIGYFYYKSESREPLLEYIFGSYDNDEVLNDEVEIIDEEKKIPEKLEICEITDETISGLRKSINVLNEDIAFKINEIIDYLDYLKSKGE